MTVLSDDIYTACYTTSQTSRTPRGRVHGTYAGHDTLCGRPIGDDGRWLIGSPGVSTVTCPKCARIIQAAEGWQP